MFYLQRVTQSLSNVAAVAIAAMGFLTVADVLMKNLFGRPIRGTFELVELFLVIVVFLGVPEVFRSETNIYVDVADQLLNSRAVALLRQFGSLASLAFLILLGWAIIAPAWDTVTYPQRTQEAGIPIFGFWIPILAGTALSIVSAAVVSWVRLRRRAVEDAH